MKLSLLFFLFFVFFGSNTMPISAEEPVFYATPSLSIACSPDRPATLAGDPVVLRAWAETSGQKLQYEWKVLFGSIKEQGREATWDLKGISAGIYTATVTAKSTSGRTIDCSLRVAVLEPDRGTTPLETGRAFLLKGTNEREGYGLYSYLLLGSHPTQSARERFLKALDAYLGSIEKISVLESEYYRRNQLNITYLPLTVLPQGNATASWLLDHYDYARARFLLSSIHKPAGDGIYIVSCLKPLGGPHSPPYLFQDLSTVPPVPGELMSWWIREFMNQAAQEHFWNPRRTRVLILNMRTTIAVLASGLPEVQRSLTAWIKIYPNDKSDK